MKVSTMRKVDAWIGVPLCFIASTVQFLMRLFRRTPIPAGPPRSILIIKLSELGALVPMESAMHGLLDQVDRHNIYFLIFAESRGLLEILDYVPPDNIFILRTDTLTQLIKSALNVLRRIRAKRIECSIDMDFFSRATALIGWLSGCHRRVGCHAYFGEGPYRGDLLTHRVKFNPHVHISQMFEILAKALDQSATDFPRVRFIPGAASRICRSFQPTAAELTGIRGLLADVGVDLQDRLILLNSNISGPAHFATLTDIEVVVLFGPETPLLWRPLGDRVTVMYRALACSPCFTVYNGRRTCCRTNICMDFSPREVYEVVRRRIADRTTGSQVSD